MDAEVIGISGNLTFSQQAFADYLKLNFPLVSDYPDLKTIEAYGVLEPQRRLPQRSYFIIDKQGIIRAADVNADYTIRLEPSETLRQLRNLTG